MRKEYYTPKNEADYGMEYICIDKGNYYEVVAKVTRLADGGTFFHVSKRDYSITECGSGSELLFNYDWANWRPYWSF